MLGLLVGLLRRAVAAFMVLFIFFPCGVTVNKMTVQNPDEIRLNVSIISDGHMEGNNAARFKGHGQAMLDFSSAETPVDALVMVGDNTMNAQEIEYMLLYGLMRKYLTVDNVLIAPGNHELCKTDAYEKYYKRFMDYNNAFFGYEHEHAYFSQEINGYKLIVMATEADSKIQAYHSEEQLRWLENELADAAASGKPAFVFNHFQLKDKFVSHWPGSDVGPQGEQLDSILKIAAPKCSISLATCTWGFMKTETAWHRREMSPTSTFRVLAKSACMAILLIAAWAGKWRFTTARSCFACATSPTANG